MVVVEMNRLVDDGYRVGATLRVNDDGTWTVEGDAALVPLEMVMIGPDGQPVSFATDPQTWARRLHTRLRTGYLVPAVVADTGPPVSAAGA